MTRREEAAFISQFRRTLEHLLERPVRIIVDKPVKTDMSALRKANEILKTVAGVYQVSIDDICSNKKGNMKISDARHTCIALIRLKTNLQFNEIKEFINRDHSSMIHSVGQYHSLRESNTDFNTRAIKCELALKLKGI